MPPPRAFFWRSVVATLVVPPLQGTPGSCGRAVGAAAAALLPASLLQQQRQQEGALRRGPGGLRSRVSGPLPEQSFPTVPTASAGGHTQQQRLAEVAGSSRVGSSRRHRLRLVTAGGSGSGSPAGASHTPVQQAQVAPNTGSDAFLRVADPGAGGSDDALPGGRLGGESTLTPSGSLVKGEQVASRPDGLRLQRDETARVQGGRISEEADGSSAQPGKAASASGGGGEASTAGAGGPRAHRTPDVASSDDPGEDYALSPPLVDAVPGTGASDGDPAIMRRVARGKSGSDNDFPDNLDGAFRKPITAGLGDQRHRGGFETLVEFRIFLWILALYLGGIVWLENGRGQPAPELIV